MPFKVYRSSAGSGKTFTLVLEYLKIVIRDPGAVRNILAITFTNKAANEMKERVLHSLRSLSASGENSGCSDDRIMELLVKDLKVAPSFIAGRASIVLRHILHNYSDFAIGTIDSFSHRLVRTFARDFRLPVNFTVELESDELLRTGVDLLLERAGEDQALTRLLVKFIETRLDDEEGWKIDKILTDFARNLLDEEGQQCIASLRNIPVDQFGKIASENINRIREFEQEISAYAKKAYELINDRNIPLSAFYQGDKGIGAYFGNLAKGKFDKLTPNSYVQKTCEEDKWLSGKISTLDRAAIDEIKPVLQQCFEAIDILVREKGPYYRLRKLLKKTIFPLGVLNEIDKVLHDYKIRKNVVHISEFNARIASVVMNEPVPFIYERLGEKFHHILIDEFQDTSALQWMNFIPLVENALANGYFNLVVGDGKQAIYRWRNGDVDQFNALPKIPGSNGNPVLRQREKSLENHFLPAVLEKNYRSRAVIIDFNNRFFSMLGETVLSPGYRSIYQDVKQHIDPAKVGGYVELEFLEANSESTVNEQTLARILEIVRNNCQSGYAFRDIAILCRSNAEAGMVAVSLMNNGIGVISSESMLLKNSPAVRFIMACLKVIFGRHDDIVKEEIRLFLENRKFTDMSISSIEGSGYSMFAIYNLCEALIRDFHLNEEPDAYLQFFLDIVLKFNMQFPGENPAFIDYWESKCDSFSISVPEQLDAVRVMTIHKSKGLQFPIVIFPFARSARKNTRDYFWSDLPDDLAPGLEISIFKPEKEMELSPLTELYAMEQDKSMLDLLNLLYVVMTRPEEKLYVITSMPPANIGTLNSFPKFFFHYLRSIDLWNDQQQRYSFGTETGPCNLERPVEKLFPIAVKEFISNDWRKKIVVRTKAPDYWKPEDPGKLSDLGNLVHIVLSWIVFRDDAPGVLSKAIQRGIMTNDDVPFVKSILDNLFDHPELSGFFSTQWQSRTEPEILLPGGKIYRPDRVVCAGDEAVVLEYKTGKPLPFHEDQLREYCMVISGMGYTQVRGLLIYLLPVLNVIEI